MHFAYQFLLMSLSYFYMHALAAVGGQEDSRVSCVNGDETGGRYFVCAFDKARRKEFCFPKI